VTLDELAALTEEGRERWLLPPDALLQSLPAVSLDDEAALRFTHGNPVGSARRPESAASMGRVGSSVSAKSMARAMCSRAG
jgi:tRNA U55 pseudouridine synthase TruB